ncbi:MAG: D-alanyl-D-alanine carboxypeptidase family protein [Kofleriaceae bacterium]
MHREWLTAIGCLHLGLVAGCVMDDSDADLDSIESAVSVSTYTTSGCSTSVVVGLSKQIAEEVDCMSPGSLVPIAASGNLVFSSNAVLPYMHSAAKTDLLAVAATRTVQVNSGFRTVAQQYLLYQWKQLGRCGISAAATPGRSNHQSGRAVDIANYSSLISAMANRGWAHDVPGDPVHFDHLSSPDIRGKDVLAFQRLWNRNNASDKISEDGAYGPQTEGRLKQAPATGFTVGASCAGTRLEPADVVMIEGPDKLAPGARARYTLTVKNNGSVEWPATTKISVASGAASPLYDAVTWVSPTEVGTIAVAIPPGEQGVLDIPVAAPAVTEETAVNTELTLSTDAGVMGTVQIALTVTPNGDEDTSGDSDDEHDDDSAEVQGGCSTSGGAGWLALVIPAVVAFRRRRRI